MGKIIGLFSLLAVLSLLVLFLKNPLAEQVEHHGTLVNATGNASECLACHDGVGAKAISNCVGINCLIRNSHAVDKPYPSDDSFVKYGDAVRGGIKLTDAQVSCISCHDLNNSAAGHLAVDEEHRNLCLRCHVK
jgi:predicted CXXCH cytochrome family protein